MKLIILLLICCFAGSCASQKKTPKKLTDAKGRPLWLTEPESGCSKRQLCAVGEGAGFLFAEGNARKELAKVFAVSINAQTSIESHSSSEQEGEMPVNAEVSESIAGKIEETTNELLQGVEIIKRFEDDEGFYALAALDRAKSSKIIKDDLVKMDQDLISLIKENKRSSLFRAKKIFNERNELEKRYQIITDASFPSSASYQNLLTKIALKKRLNQTVFLDFSEQGNSDEIRQILIRDFSNMGLKVVVNSARAHDFKVLGEISAKKEYINVKGFQKYSFHLKLTSLKGTSSKIGALSFKVTKVGREKPHSYRLSMIEIKQYLDDHLGELNLD